MSMLPERRSIAASVMQKKGTKLLLEEYHGERLICFSKKRKLLLKNDQRALNLQYLLARSETGTTLVLFDTTRLGGSFGSSPSLETGIGEIPMMELLDVNSIGFSECDRSQSGGALISFGTGLTGPFRSF